MATKVKPILKKRAGPTLTPGGVATADGVDLERIHCDRPEAEGVDDILEDKHKWDEDDNVPAASVPEDPPTSENEAEAGGRPRPKRGTGWWGHGQPLAARKKGVARPFVDGAGLPSPGRWPIAYRKLPTGTLADRL